MGNLWRSRSNLGPVSNFEISLGTLTLRASASSRLDSLQASAITEFAFIDICIRGLCQPEQAVSFRRRLRANFPLALHWSAFLDTFWVLRYVSFRVVLILLPLQGS